MDDEAPRIVIIEAPLEVFGTDTPEEAAEIWDALVDAAKAAPDGRVRFH